MLAQGHRAGRRTRRRPPWFTTRLGANRTVGFAAIATSCTDQPPSPFTNAPCCGANSRLYRLMSYGDGANSISGSLSGATTGAGVVVSCVVGRCREVPDG